MHRGGARLKRDGTEAWARIVVRPWVEPPNVRSRLACDDRDPHAACVRWLTRLDRSGNHVLAFDKHAYWRLAMGVFGLGLGTGRWIGRSGAGAARA